MNEMLTAERGRAEPSASFPQNQACSMTGTSLKISHTRKGAQAGLGIGNGIPAHSNASPKPILWIGKARHDGVSPTSGEQAGDGCVKAVFTMAKRARQRCKGPGVKKFGRLTISGFFRTHANEINSLLNFGARFSTGGG